MSEQSSPHPLKAWRNRHKPKIPLAAVATEAGVTPSFLSDVENGNKQPSLGVADRICQATAKLAGESGGGISLDDFVRARAE